MGNTLLSHGDALGGIPPLQPVAPRHHLIACAQVVKSPVVQYVSFSSLSLSPTAGPGMSTCWVKMSKATTSIIPGVHQRGHRGC